MYGVVYGVHMFLSDSDLEFSRTKHFCGFILNQLLWVLPKGLFIYYEVYKKSIFYKCNN